MVPERHHLAEPPQEAAARRPTVYQHLPPRRRIDENRVTLADVEEGDGEPSASIFAQRRVPHAEHKHEEHEDGDSLYLHAPPHPKSISHVLHERGCILAG